MPGKRALRAGMFVAVLVLGVLVWSGWRAEEGSAGSSEAPQVRTATSGQRLLTGAARSSNYPSETRAWEPGLVHRYEIRSEQDVSFRTAHAGVAAPPGMHFHLAGEWRVGVVASGEDRVDVRVAFAPAALSMTVDGKEPAAPAARRSVEQSLRTPFFLTLDRAGRVRFVHFERGTDSLAEGLLRSVVGSSQFVSAESGAEAWETSEFDSTGQYSASYHRISAGRFSKRKLGYSLLASAQGLVPIEQKARFELQAMSTFELADDLWVGTLEAVESLERELGGGVPIAASEHRLSLRLVDRLSDPSLAGALLSRHGALVSRPFASVLGARTDPLAHHRQVLGGRRFDDIVADLRALPKEEKAQDDARAAALQQLRALFVLQPAEAQKVQNVLRSGIEPVAASPMLGGLSAASTPEAIRALSRAVSDDALPSVIRTDAVAALGVAESPTAEGLDTLRRMTRQGDVPLRETATLAMGSAAMNLGASDARGADALVDEFAQAYRSAASSEEGAMFLHALGNTRAPSAMPILLEALSSDISMLRQAAVVALRNMPGPSVDELLSRVLLSDPAPEVRRSAVFACGFRPVVPLLGVLRRALQQEQAVLIRQEIVQLLGLNRSAAPEVDAALAWAGENDRSQEVRRTVSAILSPNARPLRGEL